MAQPDPWLAIGDPVETTPAPAATQAPADDPYAQIAVPVQAPPVSAAPTDQQAPDGSGFTDDQMQAIRDYLPKAKDAADLERFSLELSGGKAKIGNAQAVLDKLKNGATPDAFAFTPPTVSKAMETAPKIDDLRNQIGEGILNAIDSFFPGTGDLLRQNREAAAANINHAANSAAFDYGPEVGGLIETLLDSDSDLSNNIEHERAILAGQSATHPVASAAGELEGIIAPAAVGDAAGIANLPKLAKAGVSAAEGALYGSGAAGPDDRAAGAVVGAGLGAATEAAAPIVRRFITATKAGDTQGAAKAAQAAHELGIDLPKFVVGGPAAERKASALEQTIGGAKPISEATSKMLDQAEQARSSIAGSVGTASEPVAMGDQALDAAVGNMKAERARIGSIYDQARKAAGGTIFTASKTQNTLQQLVDNENQVLGGTKAGGVFKSLLADLKARDGKLTIDGARDTRTELRQRLRDEAGVTPDNADRLTNMVMKSVNGDIESGLIDTGNTAAIPLYRQADAQWAKQRSLEDEVLKPFLGKDMDNWGEQVAQKINSDAKGNGTRLARFLGALPEDNANNVRASLIMHLGSATDGAQNAAGDAFSLDRFLTNWNQIKGARNMIFPKDTVQALDKLATVADAVKSAGRSKNRSNTGGVISYLRSGAPTGLGAAETLFTGDPKGIAVGMLVSAMGTLRQYGAAKLLSSPAFAKKLAATPLNAAGAKAFWSRPWVNAMAVKNPAIAAEIQGFQKAFLTGANDNTLATAAAQPQEQEQQ